MPVAAATTATSVTVSWSSSLQTRAADEDDSREVTVGYVLEVSGIEPGGGFAVVYEVGRCRLTPV